MSESERERESESESEGQVRVSNGKRIYKMKNHKN